MNKLFQSFLGLFKSIHLNLFKPIQQSNKGYRPDIDGLRALAVIAVIYYHHSPDRFPGGFTGVDIFFVISGYLITGVLAKHFETKSFTSEILYFYERRIRRIFPSLIALLAFALPIGWLTFFLMNLKPLENMSPPALSFFLISLIGLKPGTLIRMQD